MSQINLLPWRQTQRDRDKKRFRCFFLAFALIISASLLLIHDYFTQPTHHQLLKTIDNTVNTVTAKIGEESLDSLHFIGLLSDGVKTWALVSQSKGLVSTVTIGDYLGREHGRVVHIDTNVMDIEKTTRGQDGIKKKMIRLHLFSKGEHVV